MGNCKDCKYWEPHKSVRREWHTCSAVDWVGMMDPLAGTQFAMYAEASDDTGLEAGLKTGPLFGCVKFQAK